LQSIPSNTFRALLEVDGSRAAKEAGDASLEVGGVFVEGELVQTTLVVAAAAVGGEGAIDERASVPTTPTVVAPAGVGEGAVRARALVLPTRAVVAPAGVGEGADAPVVATCAVVRLESADAVLEGGGAP